MTRWFSLRMICGLSMFLLVSACGGGDDIAGGGLALDTVMVTAQVSTNRLESDVITGNVCSTGEPGTIGTDKVNVTLKSTAYPGVNRILSPVTLENYEIRYIPTRPGLPALPPTTVSSIGTVIDGSSLEVPVATEALKLLLVDDLRCSTNIYEYYAVITFTVKESFTGKSGTLMSSLNVAFADRN